MESLRDRPVRIANCSGFYGDRQSALQEVVEQGGIDVITGDYLAEVTMLILAKDKVRNPELGYAKLFIRQLEPVFRTVLEKGIRIVVNAGGLNPTGLRNALLQVASNKGLAPRIATVAGDDVTESLSELQAQGHPIPHLTSGEPLETWQHEVLTANAYLGGAGIARALADGADIVITGRTADASLIVGTGMWWWGWDADAFDPLAGAMAAGHVIECGTQVTGGNFSGFQSIPGLEYPGYPIAELDWDGSSVITKHAGTGGAVTVDTVSAQLLYEINGPVYLNADVATHLDSLQLEQVGDDRVRISGVKGSPPPPTTKVSVTALGKWSNSSTFVLTGRLIEEKVALIQRTVRSKLDGASGIDDIDFTVIGAQNDDAVDQAESTVLVKISVKGDEAAVGRRFSSALVAMGLASYPGLYQLSRPGRGTNYGEYWPGLLSQDQVPHHVIHADGRREDIPAPVNTQKPPAPSQVTTSPSSAAPAVTQAKPAEQAAEENLVQLGDLAHARSGDKGGDANVGVWTPDRNNWEWLHSTLTVERFKELIPESSNLQVDRHVFSNLNALNFYVHGFLDTGATATLRLDKQAKALGEWLLSRKVPALPAQH